jgi:opacity protein-like surface antigen
MAHVLRIAALACAAVLAAAAADNQLTAEEKSAGWRLLFDGKTYAGWEDPARKSPTGDGFTIEAGCLKSLPNPKINEDLFTLETFSDFEMEFDWKISPGGNSGVKYRIQDRVMLADQKPGQWFEARVNASMKNRRTDRPSKGQEYVIGFEYQVLDNQKNPDALRGANHQAGALYDMLPPLRDATRPVGEFNHSRLVVKGDAVEHWLNGVKVVDGSLTAPEVAKGTGARWGTDSPVYELLVKHPKKECQISLQNHFSEAWFKNIKIRKL